MSEQLNRAPVTAIITAMVDNERPYVLPALNSILDQTLQPSEIRIYVAEDNSWIDELVGPRSDVVVRKIPMCNPAECRNTATAEASAEWVAYLDADDLWMPKKLAKQFAVAQANSDVGLVLCDYWYLNSDGVRFGIGRCFTLNPSCWLVKKSVMLEHPFDEKWATGQDLEWLLRIIGHVPLVRMVELLSCVRIRPDSLKAHPRNPRHKASRSFVTSMARLGNAPLRPFLIAVSYLRYRLLHPGTDLKYLVRYYLAQGHPTAAATAKRLGIESQK